MRAVWQVCPVTVCPVTDARTLGFTSILAAATGWRGRRRFQPSLDHFGEISEGEVLGATLQLLAVSWQIRLKPRITFGNFRSTRQAFCLGDARQPVANLTNGSLRLASVRVDVLS